MCGVAQNLAIGMDTLTGHYTTPHHTTLHYTTPHHTTLHHTTPHHTTLHYTTLHYSTGCTPGYTTLRYATLHFTKLQYIGLHYAFGVLWVPLGSLLGSGGHPSGALGVLLGARGPTENRQNFVWFRDVFRVTFLSIFCRSRPITLGVGGSPWALFGSPLVPLGPLGSPLGPPWVPLGPLWASVWCSKDPQKDIQAAPVAGISFWVCFWPPRGPLWVPCVPPGHPWVPLGGPLYFTTLHYT